MLEPLVADRARLQGDSDPETQLSRRWLVNALICLGNEDGARELLVCLFCGAKANGGWCSPKRREKAEQYWQTVTSEDMPDSCRRPGVTGHLPVCPTNSCRGCTNSSNGCPMVTGSDSVERAWNWRRGNRTGSARPPAHW